MKRKALLVLFSIFIVLSISGFARAEVFRVTFDAWAQNVATGTTTTDQYICFAISTWDTDGKIGPEAVDSITVTAPDTTAFTFTDDESWMPFDPSYYIMRRASEFPGGIIPSGSYKARVTDKTGKVINRYETVTVNFLDIPAVINPAPNEVVTNPTYRIKWSAVPRATAYRVFLFNDTWGEEVYSNYTGLRSAITDRTYYDLRLGDLKKGHHYRLRIEARNGDHYTNRSRTQWIPFTTE